MAVSPITGITQEDQPQALSSFLRSGVTYVFWSTPVVGLSKRIRWKPHNSADYTEVIPSLLETYNNVSCLYDPATDHLVVVWDDGDALDDSRNGTLYIARFNPVTAALVSGPTVLFQGANARLCYLSTTQNSKFLLYYKTAKNRGVYGRQSEDGGLTWEPAYPLITGQVTSTTALEVVPYDGAHVSIAQVGSSTRTLTEASMLQRTRPLTSIVKHPTLANKFFIGEPSKFDNTTLTDNLRGGLVLATDNTKLYHLDGVVQGTSDGIGAVAQMLATGTVLSVEGSSHVVGGSTRFLWRLDETSGTATAADQTGSYPLTTVSGTPTVEAGKLSNARHFTGSYIYGPSDAGTVSFLTGGPGPGLPNFTIGFWIKIPASQFGGSGVGTFKGILTLCDNSPLDLNDATLYVFFIGQTGSDSLMIGSTNNGNSGWGGFFTGLADQWVHVALVVSVGSNNITAYRNGVAFGAPISRPATTNSPTTPIWLLARGGPPASAANSTNFVLDDVWFENTNLSAGQVAAEYAASAGSAGPTGNGDDLNTYTLDPASSTPNVDLPLASCAVSLAVSPSYGYVAEYTDNSAVLGQLIVVDLTTGTTGTVFTGVTAVRAVAVANFLTPKLIFVASTESGAERLRVYEENALTPTLLLNTKITGRANSITAAVDPTNPTGALVYVSCVDRLNIYQYVSSSIPVQLIDSLTLSGGSNFFQTVAATNGNLAVAAGNSGVLVIDPSGRVLAQTPVSAKPVLDWVPSKVYALNDLVKPRSIHQFARSRYYFKASTAGTSGIGEPSWASTGTVLDNTAQWQAVGLMDGVVTGVALDETNKRIYAVGVVGGVLGTDGRVWVINASGLI